YFQLVCFSSRRRHTRSKRDWSSDVCSSDLQISSSLQAGNDFPDLELIAGRMGVKTTEVYDLVHQLLAKKLLTIEPVSESDGKQRSEERRVGKEGRTERGKELGAQRNSEIGR